jgi:phosphomannomutase
LINDSFFGRRWQEGFAGMEMLEIRDYYNGKALNLQTGFSYNLDYSGELAIQIVLSDGSRLSRVTFRPSGTEPIFKIYIAVHAGTESAALEKQERLRQEALSLIKSNLR